MIFLEILKPLGADFAVYFEAAKVFLSGGNPYSGLITRSFPYNYPPTSLYLIWPLTFFDFATANVLWNILSTLCVLLSIWLLLKLVFPNLGKLLFILVSVLFTLPFFPVKFNIGNGQINHFLLLFFVLAIYFYEKGKKNFAAIFLAFATGIKLAPAILLLYYITRKDWPQIGRFFAFLFLLIGLSFLFVPISYQLDYIFKVLPLSFTLAAKDWYYNQSLEGFLARFFDRAEIILWSTYLLSFVILFLTWLKGKKLNNLRAISAVSTLYLLIHPIALQHYFGFAIIPLILLANDMWKKRAKITSWLGLLAAYILIAMDIKNFSAVPSEFRLILSHDFFAILLLWILAMWEENTWKIVAAIWVIVITLVYLSFSLCRAGVCL